MPLNGHGVTIPMCFMTAKKIIRKLHLCLGLGSGLIVLFLGLTGCLLAFEVEIRKLTETFRDISPQNKAWLTPSQLKPIAEKHLASGKALGIEYPGKSKAAVAMYFDENNYELVFLNPYTGEVLKHKNMNRDFFRIIVAGHYNLWLPRPVGQFIVSSATLVFVMIMVTGIILWWPKNKAARKQRFTIKWNAGFKRKNYDLHNVPGFYMTWIAIFIAITGLVFGFEWVGKCIYFIASGGQQMEEHSHPMSDSTQTVQQSNMADFLWASHLKEVMPHESIGIYFANLATDPLEVVINHQPGTYYNTDFLHYDQYTGKALHAKGSYDGRFSEAAIADKIIRMNYDMHVGAILGLPGKTLAFFASLIAASLPVTGFFIWRNRKKKGIYAIVKEPLPALS